MSLCLIRAFCEILSKQTQNHANVKYCTDVCSVRCTVESLTCTSYPTYTSVLLRAIEWWYHDPNVSTPVLKLMAELVQNRSQRLHFDVSSPNGILLFRVTSEMIVAYGMKSVYSNVQVIASHSVNKNAIFDAER